MSEPLQPLDDEPRDPTRETGGLEPPTWPPMRDPAPEAFAAAHPPDRAPMPARVPQLRVVRRDRAGLLVSVLLAIVLAAGAWLRVDGQNWDDYTHLHPDERFLTDVVSALNGPLAFTDATTEEQAAHRQRCAERYAARLGPEFATFNTAGIPYFDAECSALNPNNIGKGLYVYGQFPLFMVRAAAMVRSQLSSDYHAFLQAYDAERAATHTVKSYWRTYTSAQLVGRSISALADWLTIGVLFLLGRRLYGRWVGLLAAALYAFAPFPIQQAHFWTVDAFTTFWVTLALYLAVRVMDGAGTGRTSVPLLYLLIWAGGVTWDAAHSGRPALGLVSLGLVFGVTYLVVAALRLWRGSRGGWGDVLVAGSGAIASLLYLLVWIVLILTAQSPHKMDGGVIELGLIGMVFSTAPLTAFSAVSTVRRHLRGEIIARPQLNVVAGVGVVWLALAGLYLLGAVSPWAALFVALVTAALLILDLTDLTDYVLFGVVLGAAVASRINIAPLAGIVVVAAGVRALPALDRLTHPALRWRMILTAMLGLSLAALASLIAFRLLQPHAFQGPGLFGLHFNPGWREDVAEAAYLTSGDWDAPPNHQWASRTPYFFPWRNIVLWGLGIPLGLLAWGAWAWAGVAFLRARPQWTRHALPFLWVLVAFGWLGGRWVTTMRYFLPIYPTLVVLGAWALVALLRGAWGERRAWTRRHAEAWRAVTQSRLALAGSGALLIVVLGGTIVYGLALHTIHTQQLTRVAASRWFQETVPGDLGIWVEGDDGTRQLVNLGRRGVGLAPHVVRLEQGASAEATFTLSSDADLTEVTLNLLADAGRDSDLEVVRVRIYREDPSLGRQIVFEGAIRADLNATLSPYGRSYTLRAAEPVTLRALELGMPLTYTLEITAVSGGPVLSIREWFAEGMTVLTDLQVALRQADGTPTTLDLNLPYSPILTGHGDDIPDVPTHWTVGGADVIPFDIPIDGVIRTLEIPHLGDPLGDADAETVRFTLTGPDGTTTSVMLSADLSVGADPLGPPRTITFDPPLRVQRADANGGRQQATLTIEAQDLVYTSGPVIAWEGDWDDPVPWSVCPLPDEVVYRDDLPSGLSRYDCASMNMYAGHYQGLKLWMVAEDNPQKFQALTNALDQADYIVITSNRFYDSLSRIPARWPMTLAYYDALFDGRLGFELVRTFESPLRLGPLTIRDQILPTDDLPDVLNEHWEAEEAYHVYDHPAVLVFRKTDAYSPANTRTILNSVSIRSVRTALPGYVADPEPIGVVPWGAKQASQAPTLLQFSEKQWERQREGGTWSALFPHDSPLNRSQALAVIAWWLLFVLAGWIAWPILYVALPGLPDRGYPAAKITAWLLVAWVAWVGGTLGAPLWSRAGIAALLGLLAMLSALLIVRRRAEFAAYVRSNGRALLGLEALALVLFVGFLWVRWNNPDLWHPSFGGEKPMDFAFFTGVLRSSIFPPLNPWFSGDYINYYYFGYVIVGAPTKLLGIDPAVAYNLVIPALYSMTGMGVFSIAYNWVRSRAVVPGQVLGALSAAAASESDIEREAAPARSRHARTLPAGNPWAAGLFALLLAVVLGNLGTLHVFVTAVARLDGWQQPALYQQVRRAEIEPQRSILYAEQYDALLRDFRDDHGRDPLNNDEVVRLTQEAQARTDAAIADYIEHPPLLSLWRYELGNLADQLQAFFGGLRQVLDGQELPLATHRWYWGPTRIISELPDGAGRNAIAEMPYFTFLYGDLHAHMLAFPITLLALLWLLAEIRGAGLRLRAPWEAAIALGLGAMAVGVLRPTNTWDWITYLLLGIAGLTYVTWIGASRAAQDKPLSPVFAWLWSRLSPAHVRDLWALGFAVPLALLARLAFYALELLMRNQQEARGLKYGEQWIEPSLTLSSAVAWAVAGLSLAIVLYALLLIAARARVDRRVVVGWIGRVGAFVGLTFLAGLPFTMYFATAYTSVKPWELETTPLWAYLYVHGTFIFIVIAFLAWQTGRWLREVRVGDLQGLAVPVLVVALAIGAAVLGGIVYGVREAAVAQLVVPLVAWAALLFFLPQQHPLLRAIYALMALALIISLGVELVVLDGDIGRQNTVFKFYLQVWFLLSVTGGIALAWMLRSSGRWSLWLSGLYHTGLVLLVTIALLYPLLATKARFLDRFKDGGADPPRTLDGMAYMRYAVHGESDLWFPLRGDYDMIRWLQANVEGTPVVLEAHLYPSEYHWGGRISIYTGLPTLLGWRFHQLQQHSLPDMNYLVQTRENNVAALYELTGSEGIRAALQLIHHYRIEYIVVGALERAFYGDIQTATDTLRQTAGHAAGLAKFDTMADLGLLEVVYTAPRCLDYGTPVDECSPDQVYNDKIYRVVPGATAAAFAALSTTP